MRRLYCGCEHRTGWGPRMLRPPWQRLRAGFFGVFLGLHPLQLFLDHLPLQRAHEIDEQLAGKVIVLVEKAAREQGLAPDLERLAVDAQRADLRTHRPLDLDVDLRE